MPSSTGFLISLNSNQINLGMRVGLFSICFLLCSLWMVPIVFDSNFPAHVFSWVLIGKVCDSSSWLREFNLLDIFLFCIFCFSTLISFVVFPLFSFSFLVLFMLFSFCFLIFGLSDLSVRFCSLPRGFGYSLACLFFSSSRKSALVLYLRIYACWSQGGLCSLVCSCLKLVFVL